MIIRGNILGFLFLLIGTMAGGGTLLVSKNIGLGYIVGGGVLFVLDALYRSYTETGTRIHPSRGGNLFFIPVWLIGIAVIAFGLIGNPKLPTENYAPQTPVVYGPTATSTPMSIVNVPTSSKASAPTSWPTIPAGSANVLNVTVTATEFKYDPATITATAGQTINLTVKNTGAVQHTWVLAAASVNLTIDPGKSVTQTFTAPAAGTYTFECVVAGHKNVGMAGQLVVKEVSVGGVGNVFDKVVAPAGPTPTPCRTGSAFDDIVCGTLVPNPTPRCISWRDAYHYAGRTVCVTGVVYAAYVDNPDDKQSPFIVSFDPSASFYLFSYWERLAWKDANLVGKCIEAEGTVWISKVQASIMLESPNQVRMCEK